METHHIIAQNLLHPNTAAGIPLAIAGTRAPVVAVDSRLRIRCRHRWKTIFAVRCWGLVEIEKCNKFTKQCQLLPDIGSGAGRSGKAPAQSAD